MGGSRLVKYRPAARSSSGMVVRRRVDLRVRGAAPMIDFAECAEFLALDYRESRDQIDAMERNPKFTVEEI